MNISSRTPEGTPGRCRFCGRSVQVEPSYPIADATCPHCGSLLWLSCPPRRKLSAALRRFLWETATTIVFALVVVSFCLLLWDEIGPMEIIVLVVLGVLLFGKTLPQMGHYLGKAIVELNNRKRPPPGPA
jgi:predicted RNA-binding Zn-ribbon protein involved in translation (DUF1610 family)